jgi:hypothetical protein
MSKSTPINSLPNKMETKSFEENENQLVSEILNEINNEEAPLEQAPLEQAPNSQVVNEPSPVNEQESENPIQMRVLEQELETEMNETPLGSFKEQIMNSLKRPIIVGVLVVLFSIPFVTNKLKDLLPTKEMFQNNTVVFVLLMKFVISLLVYLGLEQAL